jgi:hypothetical protein
MCADDGRGVDDEAAAAAGRPVERLAQVTPATLATSTAGALASMGLAEAEAQAEAEAEAPSWVGVPDPEVEHQLELQGAAALAELGDGWVAEAIGSLSG